MVAENSAPEEPGETEESIEDFKDAVRHGKTVKLPWRDKEFIRKNFIKAPMLRRGLDFEVSLEVDPEAETSYCTGDYLHIYLSWNNVPKNLRKYPDAVIAIWNGISLHESGHVILTKRLDNDYKKWKDVHHNNQLAAWVQNILEDSRINHKMAKENMGILGDALIESLHIHSQAWLHGLEMKTEAAVKKEPVWTGLMSNGTVMSIMALKGLYYKFVDGLLEDFLTKYYPAMTAEQKKDIDEAANIITLARSMSGWTGYLEPAAKRLYQLLVKYSPPGQTGGGGGGGSGPPGKKGKEEGEPTEAVPMDKGGIPKEDLPVDQGGDMETEVPGDVEQQYAEKDQGEIEKEQKAKEEKGASLPKVGRGGAGDVIPYPLPDMNDYSMRRDRLARIIQQMKDRLKVESSPKFVLEKYKQAGRLMSPILAKAAVAARRMPVTDIYQRTKITYEKQEAVMMLIVDLSGSVDLEVMKDTLLVLAEAAAGWLPDENFAILVFAGNYMRIKTFTESYMHVKGRIGGLPGHEYPGRLDTGDTILRPPLQTARDMFKEIRKRTAMKSLIIVSDFAIRDEEYDQDKTILEEANLKYNAIPILIANSSNRWDQKSNVARTHEAAETAKQLGDWGIIEMPEIEMLPAEFFKLYKKLAYIDRTHQKWKGMRPGGTT